MNRGDLILQSLLRHDIPTYFACQLVDFEAILSIGGIPSKWYQESVGRPPSPQVTDAADKEKGLWNLVFASLQDLGSNFHVNGRVPNPYGPILLVVSPKWLTGLVDVSVALLSGGHQKFQRDHHSIPLNRLEEVFRFPFSNSPDIRTRIELQHLFGNEMAHSNPELSAFLPNGFIPLDHVMRIIVDPYNITDVSLSEYCKALLMSEARSLPIDERLFPRSNFFKELGEAVVNGCNESRDFVMYPWRNIELQNWANSLHVSDWAYQVERWATYLRNGTFAQMRRASGA